MKVVAIEGDALDDEKFLREDTAAGWSETQAAAQLSASSRIFFNPTDAATPIFFWRR